MCRQVTHLAECGHESGSSTTQCENPTCECGGIFIKPELENVKGLCMACQKVRDQQEEPRERTRQTLKEDEDEGYCE
ncbi:hypothetical protein BJ878DRAFT_335298 [Calycina marina]|uniref:Uncharacterized protein n=1 Tax=Calycina marina TaxID=1763456 RepID=A0A9P8CG03_9HELO|nr:hypothetical protein BJ878DRAFT_335298 [Calycina marina]